MVCGMLGTDKQSSGCEWETYRASARGLASSQELVSASPFLGAEVSLLISFFRRCKKNHKEKIK